MMTLYLTRKVGTEPIPLSLPATPADIGNTFSELDAICPDPSATEIYKVDSEVRNLSRYICKANVEDSETLRKLNQLAELLQSMSREDQTKMEVVLDSNSINGMDDILNAASMVKEYILLEEVTSDRTLGNYLVAHGVIDCPENIKPYLDYVGIGAEFYSDHGGVPAGPDHGILPGLRRRGVCAWLRKKRRRKRKRRSRPRVQRAFWT